MAGAVAKIELVEHYRGQAVRMDGVRAGNDLSLTIYGGDIPHIGAVAVSVCSQALHDPGKTTVTDNLLALQGHKDGELAVRVANRLAKHFGCTVSVACGIHFREASSAEIAEIVSLVMGMVERCVAAPC